MIRQRMSKVKKPKKQLGVMVDCDLWKRFKHLGVDSDKTATELLEQAMKEFLERHDESIT